jgi:hypothetical protein
MAGSPYRIVLQRSSGQRFYYSREIEARDRYNVACTQPFFDEDVRKARRLNTPTEACARRDSFKRMWPTSRFFIESCAGGDILFEDRSSEVSRTEAPTARKNYHVDGILIVAGQSSNYYIRFPNSPFESLRGETPDEVYGKYLEAVALRPILAEYVEKYQTPEMSDAEFIAQIEETKRAIQQARFAPGRRRPGNE